LAVLAGGVQVRPDATFTRARLAVFVDGCYWHRCPEHGTRPSANPAYWGPKLDRNVDRDLRVDAALASEGWTVVRLWEHEIQADLAGCVARVRAALG
jgi:DNA mismatch endonuclease (patch repair protein)